MNGRSKVLTWGLPLIGAATLIGGTGMVVENRPIAPEEVPPRPPTTSPTAANPADAASYIGAIGTSEPAGEAIAIAAHTSGVVESVAARVGDRVAAGEPLFVVDRRRAEAEVALRRTQVAVAEEELRSLRATVPPLAAALVSAEAALESATSDVGVADADLADRRNLLRIAESVSDPRAISEEEVDRRRFAVRQSEARRASVVAGVRQAEARVQEAGAELSRYIEPDTGSDGPELVAAAARVDQARRELDRAIADLELLTVTSPIAGQVLQVNIRAGEFAPASVPTEGLIVLGRDGARHLRVEIDEVDIPRFSRAARAWASPRGAADTRVALELVLVEPLVVPKENLSGRTSELVDTRVLQVVYALGGSFDSPGVGQQFDVYIEADGSGS